MRLDMGQDHVTDIGLIRCRAGIAHHAACRCVVPAAADLKAFARRIGQPDDHRLGPDRSFARKLARNAAQMGKGASAIGEDDQRPAALCAARKPAWRADMDFVLPAGNRIGQRYDHGSLIAARLCQGG